ncbi:MAG TPA: RNA-binding domain-containing protein [Ktedonobacteraceae bacterium]|nr:RNA-binding domain-containing protein [Ktedonobacteraceae bacterium]
MTLNLVHARDALQELNYQQLYITVLGWNAPGRQKLPQVQVDEGTYSLTPIAEMAGVSIIEVRPGNQTGKIPGASSRKQIAQDLAKTIREHLLIFLDGSRTQSLWYLLKREGQRAIPREHLYVRGQPGDLALGKLESMVFDLADLEEGTPSVLEVAKKLKDALDVERVTKSFYKDFKEKREEFANYISGIDDERDRKWYVSVLLNRLMFIYFLQRKFFLDGGKGDYLQSKLSQVQAEYGPDRYYDVFLRLLFFEGFAIPPDDRSTDARRLLGTIKYLNGGLFLKHRIEQDWPEISIPDQAFESLFKLFTSYTWNLDDTPAGKDNELRPHVLGYIFEKYINQKSFGAYYTRPEITDYLCERTIHEYILQRISASNGPVVPGAPELRHFETLPELMINLDARLCRELIEILPKIRILDPACGSGAFLVSALNTLVNIYSILVGKIQVLHDSNLNGWLSEVQAEHASFAYSIRKKVITENLYGVDLMEEAMEIAKLRLFITLVSSVENVEQLEPLPNIDFNILPGNSLIGFPHINAEQVSQLSLLYPSFHQLVAEKTRLIGQYKSATEYGEDLRSIRNQIDGQRAQANVAFNQVLLSEFTRLGIRYEETTWDAEKQTLGKTKRRAPQFADITALHPFHWSYEFNEVMETYGGFDIIIANPPWEALKPQAKEFFALHESTITKNKMRIEDFEKEQSKLLQNKETRQQWLAYQSAFPYQSEYFRTSPQYPNQVSVVDGKKQGTDINLYKLFTEQCYNLLREGGLCGLVVPSGIYTDLGTKQLREMLFSTTRVTGLFGFENRKNIFEGVDSRFKFVVLTFEKGGQTSEFPAAFMRHEVSELVKFPQQGAQIMSVNLIHKLSPASLSIMEFKNNLDTTIAHKMQLFPLMGEKFSNTWNLVLGNEFHMTNDHGLFQPRPGPGRLPLYEGKMMHQFTHTLRSPRYWVNEREGRRAILGRVADANQQLNYQKYRLGHRSIARSTDTRTMIATILPPNIFFGHSINASTNPLSEAELLFATSLLNSFVLDFSLRQRVSANLTMFYIYQLPVPRPTSEDLVFRLIVQQAAQLICTTPEFADLWQAIFPGSTWSPTVAATDPEQRAQLRAEIDGLVAHLYNLTAEEFQYILGTFPLVEQGVRDAALQAYEDFALMPADLELLELSTQGESATLEFKVAACWNKALGSKDDKTRDKVMQEIAGFLNSPEGGTLLIGVADDGTIVGLEEDYRAANPQKQNRDGYELYLLQHIRNFLGGIWHLYYQISFGTVQGKEVCRIDVKPAPEGVYTSHGEFYIREGTITRKLTPQETMAYHKTRWP